VFRHQQQANGQIQQLSQTTGAGIDLGMIGDEDLSRNPKKPEIDSSHNDCLTKTVGYAVVVEATDERGPKVEVTPRRERTIRPSLESIAGVNNTRHPQQ
jgi:hypothetical protein